MRRFAHRERADLAIVAAGVALAIAIILVLVAKDDKPTPGQQARLVLRDAANRQRRGSDHRPDFRIYTLGERFRREDATRLLDRCETHADEVEVFYGPCRDGGESGCGYDASVRSQPACLRPRELDAMFNTPPDADLAPGTITTVRGVPAVIGEGQIVLMTRDTLITLQADGARARSTRYARPRAPQPRCPSRTPRWSTASSATGSAPHNGRWRYATRTPQPRASMVLAPESQRPLASALDEQAAAAAA
ncbi:MAG TPA: hypothetical protein VK501_28510 [Baekduia sp.]|uniref:hypothetical protein n=1 Tax=Baekduia sp. TaxID=2600305 RepID=UPI002C50D9CF|nr:hypothetical protein [Baekduia sp.]HMJ37885.1 hypothetical protein [Baekduia sp.]